MEERAYTIPLRVVYNRAARKERAKRAMKHIREFVARHMHADPENVKIHTSVNEIVWQRGIEKPPRKVKIVAVKDGDTIWVYTPEARAELAKAEKKVSKKRKTSKKKEAAEEKKEEGRGHRGEDGSEEGGGGAARRGKDRGEE